MAAPDKTDRNTDLQITLGEAAGNSDGTYNGFKALAWMSSALSGGKGLTEKEVKELWEEQQQKKEKQS